MSGVTRVFRNVVGAVTQAVGLSSAAPTAAAAAAPTASAAASPAADATAQQQAASQARGMTSTMLTGVTGEEEANLKTSKTLLGQ